MSAAASSSKLPLKHTTRSSRREKESEGVDIQQNEPSTASQLQSVDQQSTNDRQDAHIRERKESPLINGDAQRSKNPDRLIRQKGSHTASRLQSASQQLTGDVRDKTTRESGREESPSNDRGYGDVQRKAGAGPNPVHSVRRKAASTVARLQPVSKRADDVQDMKNREGGRGHAESSLINRGSRAVQRQKTGSRATPDRLIQQNTLQFTENIRDSQTREYGRGELPMTNRGCEDAQRKPGGGVNPNRPIPQKTSPAATRLQSVGRRTIDVRHVPSRGAGRGESSLTDRGSRNAQIKVKGKIKTDDSIQIEALTAKENSVTMLQGASNFQISNANFTAIGGNATIIRFGDDKFTDVQRDLIGDYIATFAALPGINDNVKKHILTQLIINLPRAEAVFNDYQTKKKSGPCFEGTRVALLREMADWLTGQDESRMYILSGLAGIGKSTVAYTIASRAADLNLLGASFFFSRDEADRNNAKKLFTTIAYQLCVYDERFSEAIGDALRTEPAATTKAPLEQLQVLILGPLQSIVQSCARPILVVVDALDECCEEDVRAVIHGLSQLVGNLSSFKVILTTRPRPFFDRLMSSNQGGHKLFHLQDIEDKIVDDDIRLYLRHNLSLENVREHHPRRQWCASDEEIDSLVCAAGRLFIIAATSVRYILDKSASNPSARAQELLKACSQDRSPFKDLNQFYAIILRNAVPVNCDDYYTINRYQSVVGAIILVQRPLSVSTLAHLIDIDTEDIYTVLDCLQSVILLGDNDVPRVYHKSFPDYLTDNTNCKESELRIDPKNCHGRIAMRCFEIANKCLQYNMLGLGTPTRFMNNEDAFKEDGITKEQLQEKIPEHLRYACIYWAAHLKATNIEDSDIMNGLDKFVNEHALHWFEVLSLIGKLEVAHRAIRVALKLLKSTSSGLQQFLSDALRFISKFYELINESALHTYYSALPFSPTESLLYRQYIKEAVDGICNVEDGPVKWDPLVTDRSQEDPADVVKFSLDSTLFVSHSEESDKELKLRDATTGAPISTIPGNKISISNDFSIIASSEDKVITCYNQDGSAMGTMITTPSTIIKLSLSSESNRIAALLSDGTVCLWQSSNGELIGSFDDGETDDRLQFSCSGTRFAYSSPKDIVKLRDGINGRLVADLHCGSDSRFEFSADGCRIASLSYVRGLGLWNTESGGLIGEARIGHWNFAISANGSLLATADTNNVTLWSETCGQLTQIQVLDCIVSHSIAFSPDNLLGIGNFSGIKIYNIETHTMSTLLSRSLPIFSFYGPMAFSPDGTRLATERVLCDVQAIDASATPSRAGRVTVMALSRDCSRLACGFDDSTVEQWETGPTMRRIAVNKCSDHMGAMAMNFAPDGGMFASGSFGGTVNLWNGGDGSLHGTLTTHIRLQTVELSNHMLIAGGESSTALVWDLDALSLTHTIELSGNAARNGSISDDGDLAVIAFDDNSVDLYDLTNHTATRVGTFNFQRNDDIQSLAFLPDKSHVVAQFYDGGFQSLNLANKCIANKPMLEHLIQLPSTPLWHGVPLLVNWPKGQRPVLFSQFQSRVPLLWVPTDTVATALAQGSCMIALGCDNGHIILLRLHTS